jgi:hypothetical protein
VRIRVSWTPEYNCSGLGHQEAHKPGASP